MAIKKTCTIITTHLPKFNYAYSFIESFNKFVNKDHDLFLIFSNEYEYDCFDKNLIKYFKPIFLSQHLRDKQSIVNVKKFDALNQLSGNYEYYGVFDCESLFVKESNLDIIYEEIASKNEIKSNISTIGASIIRKCSEFLNLSNNEILIKETKNFNTYWWFNEIPVYRNDLFTEFYSWYINHENIHILQREYYAFDFLVYGIWLICFKNFKIKNYELPFECEIGAVENFRLSQQQRDFVSESFDSFWSTNKMNIDKYSKAKILFHSDNC
jgi:hypothetical protein